MAKRRDSRYEPGLRSGAWQKMRVNQGQEFVIGGYTVGGKTFDALVFGYYEGGKLMYAARTRNGFTPKLRDELLKRFARWRRPTVPSPICRKSDRPLGCRPDRGQDAGMPMAQAGTGRPVRVRRMDT